MSFVKELEEKRAELWNTTKVFVDKVVAEKRGFTPAEQTEYDARKEQLDGLRASIDHWTEKEGNLARSEQSLKRLADQPIVLPGGSYKSPSERALDDQFRSAILERNPAPIEARDANPRMISQPGVELRTGLNLGTAAATGVGIVGKVLVNMVETSAVLRAGAHVLTTDTGEPMRIPTQNAYSAAAIVPEGTTIPESDPGMNTITLGAYKYAFLVNVSNELAADAGFGLSGYLAAEAGTAMGNGLGQHLMTGTGTGQPTGAMTAATLGVTGPVGTATSLGAQGTVGQGTDILNNLVGSLAEPYTRSAAAGFLLRTNTLTQIRNLKSTYGELVGPEYLAAPPAPFYVDPFVPSMAANAKSIIFGDWSRYWVRLVNGIKFEMSRDYAFGSDQTTFRVTLRADGNLIDQTGALKYFVNSAT